MVVKGTTTGIPTAVLVPGICVVKILDAMLVGPVESIVLENTMFVISEPVEARLPAVGVPVLVRSDTGADPPAVAPSIGAVGTLKLTNTELDEAVEVVTTNEADGAVVEPSA